MTDDNSFSHRHGFVTYPPITITTDAPNWLRNAILKLAQESGTGEHSRWAVVRELSELLHPEEPVSVYPSEAIEMIEEVFQELEWFQVYDALERFSSLVDDEYYEFYQFAQLEFDERISRYFRRNGVGWQLKDGKVLARGEEAYERAVSDAKEALQQAGMATAQNEIEEAIRDLSRRPEPDLTGAVTHAMGALECAAKEISGKPKLTLGQMINEARKNHVNLGIEKPLLSCIEKGWGYASQHGRHVVEGRAPDRAEAELIVHLSATVATYVCRKLRSKSAD